MSDGCGCTPATVWQDLLEQPEQNNNPRHASFPLTSDRYRIAARARAAQDRACGALRVRLLDSAQGRRKAGRRPRRRRRGLHRSARVGRGVLAGRGLDRPRRDQRPAVRAKGTFRSRARPSPATAAPISGSFGWDKRDDDDDSRRAVRLRRWRSRASRIARARPSPTPTRSGRRCSRCGDAGRSARSRRATCASRWAASRRSWPWTIPKATSGTPPRSVRPSASTPTSCCGGSTKRFAPGGLLHHGQGKWYPGEPLPRWALLLLLPQGRRAGLAGPGSVRASEHGRRATASPKPTASCARSPSALGIDDRARAAGLRRRLLLPVARAEAAGQRRSVRRQARRSARARRGLRRVFEQGLEARCGSRCRCSAPGERRAALGERTVVHARRAHVLDPGRFADGLSLAARLSAVGGAEGERRSCYRAIRWRRASSLPPRTQLGAAHAAARARGPHRPQRTSCSAPRCGRPVRTAISRAPRCASRRATASLHVFMPPLALLEEYLELVAAIEDTAARAGPAGAHRGLPPAERSAPQRIQVTPDPGVIEVNIHPARVVGRARSQQHDSPLRRGQAVPACRARSS